MSNPYESPNHHKQKQWHNKTCEYISKTCTYIIWFTLLGLCITVAAFFMSKT
jgi:hypothetical protein